MDQINIISSNFQTEIVNIFNKYNLPFLLKYYLFKEIWQKIDEEKFKNDYNIKMSKQQQQQQEEQHVISKDIDLPDDFIQEIKTKEDKK